MVAVALSLGVPLAGEPVVVAVGVGVTAAACTLVETDAVHVTVPPPPLPEPLHWSIVTGRAALCVELVVTEH
jgi:hypothetical protein